MNKPLPLIVKYLLGIMLLCLTTHVSMGQIIINQYLPVNSFSGNTLNCGSARNGNNNYFQKDARVLVVQMQKAPNTYSSGDIEALNKAGLYEVRYVSSYSGNILILDKALNSSLFDATGSIQVVSYPEMGDATTGAYTPTTSLTAHEWDGTTGGILVFSVSGTLTLNNNINLDVSGKGFRGGRVSANESGSSCRQYTRRGGNGEGVVKNSWHFNLNNLPSDLVIATTNKANGGGGGANINNGGGGGGNFTKGGDGGNYEGGAGGIGCDVTAGTGQAGKALFDLANNPAPTDLYLLLGGGGGGGHQNNTVGTDGADGGGIIIAITGTLKVSGNVNIHAKGATALKSTINEYGDGAGGGGAGGVILLQAQTCDIATTSTFTVNTSGGDGGDVDDLRVYGGGGGGGQGFVYRSTCIPETSVTNNPGNAGKKCRICTDKNADNGIASSKNQSVIAVTTALPILDLRLKGKASTQGNLLQWQTTWQVDVSYYEVERSTDGLLFLPIQRVYANGNSSKALYEYLDTQHPVQEYYYRLKVVYLNGDYTYSINISLQTDAGTARLLAYPSPLQGQVLQLQAQDLRPHAQAVLSVFSAMGNLVLELPLRTDAQGNWQATLPQSTTWSKGVYLLRMQQPSIQLVQRVVVQ